MKKWNLRRKKKEIQGTGEGYDWPFEITDGITGRSANVWSKALSAKEVKRCYDLESPFMAQLERMNERDDAMNFR